MTEGNLVISADRRMSSVWAMSISGWLGASGTDRTCTPPYWCAQAQPRCLKHHFFFFFFSEQARAMEGVGLRPRFPLSFALRRLSSHLIYHEWGNTNLMLTENNSPGYVASWRSPLWQHKEKVWFRVYIGFLSKKCPVVACPYLLHGIQERTQLAGLLGVLQPSPNDTPGTQTSSLTFPRKVFVPAAFLQWKQRALPFF